VSVEIVVGELWDREHVVECHTIDGEPSIRALSAAEKRLRVAFAATSGSEMDGVVVIA